MLAAAFWSLLGPGRAVGITGSSVGLIVLVEGVQQLCRFQQNWVGYRTPAESLKHEKCLYHRHAGHHPDVPRPELLIAERVERLVPEELSAWSSAHAEASRGRES